MQSIYNPSWIQDWHQEGKIWAKGRRYSSCLWILWTKNTMILTRSTWKQRVLHNTCTKHGRNIKTRCIGLTSNLLIRKNLSSIKNKSNAIILYDTLPAYCISKVVVMKSGEVKNEKVFASPRPLPKITFEDNWMKELGSEVAGRSCWK